MMSTRTERPRRPLHRSLVAFWAADRGAISFEFMIIFPTLLIMLVASFGYFEAFRSTSMTSKIAFAVNDIMSRHDTVDTVDMQNLFAVAEKMMPPTITDLRMRVTSVCFENNTYKVLWSYVDAETGATTPAQMASADIPISVMPTVDAQNSAIITEIWGTWTPFMTLAGLAPRTVESRLVIRPRFVRIIPHDTLNPSNICPTS
ncbi:MAG: TadE/TadG family type IV pilus assembly protein [Pseudomonadota bacterium]